MFGIFIEILSLATIIAALAAFILSLMRKTGMLEWLQVHAPSEFLWKLFSCHFCCSWWVCFILCIGASLGLASGGLILILAPVSTMITLKLW